LASNITALTGVFKSIDCSTGLSCLTGVFKSIDCSTGLTAPLGTINQLVATSHVSANSVLATNLSVGSGLTVGGNFNQGASVFTSGGTSGTNADTKWSTVQQLTNSLCFVKCTNATANYFRLPTAAIGLAVNIVNIGSSAIILPAVSEVVMHNSLGTSTSGITLGAGEANANAAKLVCDGTKWWYANNA
jgi:hypothetical protein